MRRGQSGLVICLVVSIILMAAGCETMGQDTKRGAIGGSLVGAIAGGVLGHQSGHGMEGAAIGAGVGALTGGLIGNKIEKNKEQIMSSGEKLGISDVIVLSKAGLSDEAIISKIQKTGSVYSISVEEIEALRKEGVSAVVLNYMLSGR